LGVGSVLVAFRMEGGHLSAIVQAPAMILVILGTIGAATVTTSIENLRKVPKMLKIIFRNNNYDSYGIIEQITKMAENARRDGILALERSLKGIRNPFYHQALQLLIDGTEMTALRSILETELNNMSNRHKAGILLFQKLGGFSPTMGIIGTVLGLIHSLANADNANQMASSIASAFIATLWGVALANLVYLPISDKLKRRHEEEIQHLNLILEGMVAIQSGENPRVIRSKLLSFIEPVLRKDIK
ncbi:MAG: motility protein A, partial [candidate division Zixibacteria bacterium CG_4_9_14_3_um_filter_46_8]